MKSIPRVFPENEKENNDFLQLDECNAFRQVSHLAFLAMDL
jgi:hypothetical protein